MERTEVTEKTEKTEIDIGNDQSFWMIIWKWHSSFIILQCFTCWGSPSGWGEGMRNGHLVFIRRYTWRFVFWRKGIWQFQSNSQRQSNGWRPLGMYSRHTIDWCTRVHIGVGFGVARSDCLGHARASLRGTSDKRTPHVVSFLYYLPAWILGCYRAKLIHN